MVAARAAPQQETTILDAYLRAALRPAPLIAFGVAAVAMSAGLWLTGAAALLLGLGLAARAARGIDARLRAALAGSSVVLDPALRQRLAALPAELRSARRITGAEQLGMQAFQQLQDLTAAFLAYRHLLGARFSRGELTHGRYLRAGEQVFLAALDDLLRAVAALRGLATLDPDQLRAQLRILERRDDLSASETRELEALRERAALREAEVEALRGLLAANEQALTQLAAAHAALRAVRTERGMAELESHHAMLELEELSQRVQRYDINPARQRTPAD